MDYPSYSGGASNLSACSSCMTLRRFSTSVLRPMISFGDNEATSDPVPRVDGGSLLDHGAVME